MWVKVNLTKMSTQHKQRNCYGSFSSFFVFFFVFLFLFFSFSCRITVCCRDLRKLWMPFGRHAFFFSRQSGLCPFPSASLPTSMWHKLSQLIVCFYVFMLYVAWNKEDFLEILHVLSLFCPIKKRSRKSLVCVCLFVFSRTLAVNSVSDFSALLFVQSKSVQSSILLWPNLNLSTFFLIFRPELTLCGWQYVKIQFLNSCFSSSS